MPSVTSLTAARMLTIEDSSVVSGAIDGTGHLILTTYGGDTIDAGSVTATIVSATTSVQGLVELATDVETQAGTDSTRAVTPFALASIPGSKVQILTGKVESDLPSTFPSGVSVLNLTGSAWSLNSGSGTVVTYYLDTNHGLQVFYAINGGTTYSRSWVREYHPSNGGGGWTPWSEIVLRATLTAGSFTQTTAFTSYPQGESRLYYTTATGSSWDFSGKATEVITVRDGTDFAKQTARIHVGGSSGITEEWNRTANSASGWSPWRMFASSAQSGGLPSAMASGLVTITPTGANTPTSATITFPSGRFASAPNMQVTAQTTVPSGSGVVGVSAYNVTATGAEIWVVRANTSATPIWWLATLF